jgi:hypothetical protein
LHEQHAFPLPLALKIREMFLSKNKHNSNKEEAKLHLYIRPSTLERCRVERDARVN